MFELNVAVLLPISFLSFLIYAPIQTLLELLMSAPLRNTGNSVTERNKDAFEKQHHKNTVGYVLTFLYMALNFFLIFYFNAFLSAS